MFGREKNAPEGLEPVRVENRVILRRYFLGNAVFPNGKKFFLHWNETGLYIDGYDFEVGKTTGENKLSGEKIIINEKKGNLLGLSRVSIYFQIEMRSCSSLIFSTLHLLKQDFMLLT